ncbi:hypothetical protein [Pseudoalteromonas sp. S16_S37]|uniref:hypothetical protein n=1 Tax=Pseudoalteromonas sp. S16_S37 TaxID=2720228 RepID=UPI0016802E55|nr:hypothetical protein [Pseudoalteromonas sp. S16_S37]MBD1582499.1 hypothetical protein [Pseudoalteromonas sp. S16_S37]
MPTFEEHLVSLTQTNADLVTSNNELTKNVIDKLGQINQRVEAAEQQMNDFAQDLLKHRIVGGNLLMDPWLMNTTLETVEGVEKLVPATPPFLPTGEVKMAAVSQNTYAFGTEYPHLSVQQYQEQNAERFTDEPWLARSEKPIFAKLYNKQIMPYGGLEGGLDKWSKLNKQGYISQFLIPKQTEQSPYSAAIELNVGRNRASAGGLYLFRAWVYVKSGKLIFGDHAGYGRKAQGERAWSESEFSKDNSEHPFKFVEFKISSARYNGNSLRQLNFASGDNNSDLECYIASPQLFALDHPDDNKKPMTGETFGGHYA